MNRITEFVEDFIPKNLSKKQKEKLKEEFTCHILDKKDYYVDLGYGEEESIEKAIEDFCTDEKDKNYINNEFENLYSEKTWFAVLVFFTIAAINLLCLLGGLWVYTADLKGYPDTMGVIGGFGVIFLILFIVAVARIKMYRKSLIAAGIVNVLITASLFLCVYPQNASYAIVYNLIYLIDRFTPFSMSNTIIYGGDSLWLAILFSGIPLLIALYCFISAIRIKKGKAKSVKNPKVKLAIFSCAFLVVSVASGLMCDTSEKYIDDYPVWFNSSCNLFSPQTEEAFEEITIGGSYAEVQNFLRSKGFVNIDEYKKSLDRITLKQFNSELKEYDFYDNYEIWYMPDYLTEYRTAIYGNGFVGIMNSGDKVTGICIGDIKKEIYVEKTSLYDMGVYFGYWNDVSYEILETVEIFRNFKKGDTEEDVLSKITDAYGFIYGKNFYVKNGVEKHIYRIYSHGIVNPEIKNYYEAIDSRYFELTFENGKLTSGTMYDKVYENNKTTVVQENIK
ncbi:MAG: hypothetical protein J6D06_08705 [Clostridia bacterium]|nr:hypothetical protein [Clostridia bacterium]